MVIRTIHIVYPAVSLAVCNTARPIAESGSSRDSSWCALARKARALRQHKIETFPIANRVHKRLKIKPSHLERKKKSFFFLSSRAILSSTSDDRYSPLLFAGNIFEITVPFFSLIFVRAIIRRWIIRTQIKVQCLPDMLFLSLESFAKLLSTQGSV